ncbi:MAG: endonuclease/exonuclease/phosphatase family protein, partial [Amnibacterium sp.]
ERVGAARLLDRETGRRFLAGTIHATPLTDPNVVRRRQIAAALEGIDRLGPDLPLLLAGDLNHPWFLGGLERRLASRGRTLVRSDVGTFHGLGPRGAFDVAIVRGLPLESATTLPRRASDHRPVRFDLELAPPQQG